MPMHISMWLPSPIPAPLLPLPSAARRRWRSSSGSAIDMKSVAGADGSRPRAPTIRPRSGPSFTLPSRRSRSARASSSMALQFDLSPGIPGHCELESSILRSTRRKTHEAEAVQRREDHRRAEGARGWGQGGRHLPPARASARRPSTPGGRSTAAWRRAKRSGCASSRRRTPSSSGSSRTRCSTCRR